MIRRAIAACGTAALLTIGLATGCTADRSAEAERIRVELQPLPGVASVDVGYVNDFENGANLTIELDMVDATEEQIGALARRVDELTGTTFDDHRRTTSITVADSAILQYQGRIDADAAPAETRLLRAVPRQADAGIAEWQHAEGRSRLEIRNSRAPDTDLKAVLAQVSSGEAPTVVYIRSAVPRERSSWEVTLPMTVGQMEAIVAARDALPVVVFQADAYAARITGLSVELGTSATGYRNAMQIVDQLAPTPAAPLTVQWRLANAAPGEIGTFTACSPRADLIDRPVAGFHELEELFQAQLADCPQ